MHAGNLLEGYKRRVDQSRDLSSRAEANSINLVGCDTGVGSLNLWALRWGIQPLNWRCSKERVQSGMKILVKDNSSLWSLL